MERLRALSSSSDPFVYAATIYIIKEIGQPVPYYRGALAGGSTLSADYRSTTPKDPRSWTIDHVATWVSEQSFRAYRQAFSSQLVNGRMLLELTDEDCAESLGVPSRLHRKAILLAVEALRSSCEATSTSGTKSAAAPDIPVPAAEPAESALFDCFISYRRSGGADFAQLLKVRLAFPHKRVQLVLAWGRAHRSNSSTPSKAGVPRSCRPDLFSRRRQPWPRTLLRGAGDAPAQVRLPMHCACPDPLPAANAGRAPSYSSGATAALIAS